MFIFKGFISKHIPSISLFYSSPRRRPWNMASSCHAHNLLYYSRSSLQLFPLPSLPPPPPFHSAPALLLLTHKNLFFCVCVCVREREMWEIDCCVDGGRRGCNFVKQGAADTDTVRPGQLSLNRDRAPLSPPPLPLFFGVAMGGWGGGRRIKGARNKDRCGGRRRRLLSQKKMRTFCYIWRQHSFLIR